jgi:hypothetical protein
MLNFFMLVRMVLKFDDRPRVEMGKCVLKFYNLICIWLRAILMLQGNQLAFLVVYVIRTYIRHKGEQKAMKCKINSFS